ncbi:serine/threonine protein kinase [Amycolatopsis xylanica]|uniref:non-specific serine/threonine protein kinase n=1 Tax=Amycolatopsis xylanica TaxID=589385 RepID=A0A1H3AX20_9PSEU|nr:Stk1 family PASTA domain-containing Ser/Thr kinase [Amycolatopsis xylanica]SDX34237.1 serine/threonine protein kinase [Amycolatopsis xylanica]
MSTPRLLSNRYELGDTLGYGGMSEVHHGHDVRLGREVAIKILRADLARDPQFQERFRREAQNAAALNHPAIVAVYDTGEANTEFGPLPYIVMEYVEGRTLRDIVKTEGPMSQKRAMEVMADVCAALDFSHRHSIVHRDVKPANVMITKNGAVKVMDFGIARAMHDGQSAMTQTAAVIGTAQYLSPEQARGEQVDARSDVYAAGCVLYELVTGEPPFTGDSPVAVAYQHVREDPKPPSSVNPAVSPELDAVVLKALSKGPANRYQSSAEMRSDLVRTLSGQRPSAPMVMSEDERTQVMDSDRRQSQRYDDFAAAMDEEDPRAKRRRRTIIAVVAGILVAGAALLIMWLMGAFKETTTEAQVPNVVGMTEAEAGSQLRSAGFVYEKIPIPCGVQNTGKINCTNEQINKVLAVDPSAGAKVPTTTKIKLTVGVNPGKVQVPDLVGKTRTEAETALAPQGLTLNPAVEEVDVDDDKQAGKVQEQNPSGGSTVDQGTQVTIKIGKTKEQKTVTDYTGKTFAEAKAGLTAAGFTVQRKDVDSDKPKDQVVSQKPNGGSVAVGTQIVLEVSNGSQTQFKMPNLVGMTEDQMNAELAKLRSSGWGGKIIQKSKGTFNPTDVGTVASTDPSAGATLTQKQDVTVTVYSNNGGQTTTPTKTGFPGVP